MTPPTTTSAAATDEHARRVAAAAFVGTAMEWYDFFLFGAAASLVFNRLYFTGEPAAATLAALATFAVGFVARPLGAIVFGHLGDRIGRRTTLIVTVTMIGVVTGLIGLLPSYADVGLLAPVALVVLRVLQGVAVGGEWAGAVTLAVEHAPLVRRGRYATMPQIGSPVGSVLSSGAFFAVSLLPQGSFDAWGWRVPFLVAFPLLLVALYLRRRVAESPRFERLRSEQGRATSPVREVVVHAWPQLLVGAGTALLGLGGFYLATTFVISYGTGTLHLPGTLLLGATLIAAVVEIPLLVVCGRLAERHGAARVTIAGAVASLVCAFPMFWLVDTRVTGLVLLGVTLGRLVLSIPYAVSGYLLAELFPARLRYSGVGLANNAAAVVSGFVPLIASALLVAAGGASWTAALIVVVLALVTLASAPLVPRFATPDPS
jgi:MFS family permease